MLTAYIIACILGAAGAVLFGTGWEMGQKNEAYSAIGWLFIGVVFMVVGGLIALIQWLML